MLNTSDWPNDASVCSLSEVLTAEPIPQRYYLSPKACAGILRRAEARRKTLPQPLLAALQAVAAMASTQTLPTACNPCQSETT